MKKLLALFLALLMPACALAETYSLSVSLETDDELAKRYFKEMLLANPMESTGNADALAAAMQQILDGLGFEAAFQEDAMSMEVRLGGGTLLDMVVHAAEEAAWLTTSLLPGYALVEKTAEASASDMALLRDLEETDWTAVCAGVKAAAEAWGSSMEPETVNGIFSGDAFEGGTQCTTTMLTDMDIAALVSAVATEELRGAVTLLLKAAGLDAADLLDRLDELNDRVADEDQYAYILRVVRDDSDKLVGLSLTIMDEVAQVATASLGLGEKSAKLVVGLGMDAQNYWWEFTGSVSQLRNVYYLGGESREWVADKTESFAYVSATNAPVSHFTWKCNVTKSGKRYLWDGGVYEGDNKSTYSYLCSGNGSFAPESSTLSFTLSLGASPYKPLTLDVSFGPSAAIAPLEDGLVHCSMSDPADAALYDKLVNQLSAALMARMLKLLPIDVMMTLNQFALPE